MKSIIYLAACLGLFHASACFAQMYTVYDLGTFGGRWSMATGINASGQVVGMASFADDARGKPAYHAFRTAANMPIKPALDDLGALGGAPSISEATGINDSGQVVGWASSSNFGQEAFRTAPNRAINPATDGLGTLGGSGSVATAINNSGQVVGWSYISGYSPFHAFRTAGNMPIDRESDDLSRGSVGDSEAIGINNSGQVVGEFRDPYSRSFRTAPNSSVNPATDNLGGQGIASSINAFGQVVGYAYFGEWTNIRAFRTAPNSPINPALDDLGTLDPLNSVGLGSWASSVNSYGQVVGESAMWTGPDRAFLFDGVMHDLNALISVSSGWLVTGAAAINDAGQIAANGYLRNELHAVLLNPIYKANVRQPIHGDGSSVFSTKRGVVPVKFAITEYNQPSCELPATISITKAAGGTLASVDESIYSTNAGSGSNFRIDRTSCQYVYNLAASALGTGTYRVDININGIMVGHAVFALQ